MWTRNEVDTNAKHTKGKGTIEERKVSLTSKYHVIRVDKSLVRHHWLLGFDKANDTTDDTSALHSIGQADPCIPRLLPNLAETIFEKMYLTCISVF